MVGLVSDTAAWKDDTDIDSGDKVSNLRVYNKPTYLTLLTLAGELVEKEGISYDEIQTIGQVGNETEIGYYRAEVLELSIIITFNTLTDWRIRVSQRSLATEGDDILVTENGDILIEE